MTQNNVAVDTAKEVLLAGAVGTNTCKEDVTPVQTQTNNNPAPVMKNPGMSGNMHIDTKTTI